MTSRQEVKKELIETDSEFRRLYEEHQKYERFCQTMFLRNWRGSENSGWPPGRTELNPLLCERDTIPAA